MTPASNPKKRKACPISHADFDGIKYENKSFKKANTRLQEKVVKLRKENSEKDDALEALKSKMEREKVAMECRLVGRDTQIANLRNQIETIKETKAVITAKVISDRVAIESKVRAECDVAKAQLREIRLECKQAYNDKAATKSQFEQRGEQLREVQLQNTRLVEENAWYTKEIKSKDDMIFSQRKTIETLNKENALLKDQRHDKLIKQKELSNEGKQLDLLIEDKKTSKGIAIEDAKKDRMTFVEQTKTSLKVEFAKKKKADQEKALHKKQEDNNKKLQAQISMVSNTHSPFASLHYTMNRFNPSHGQFMNRRQLDEVSDIWYLEI